MAFDNSTNHGRVKKILDTLALIEKSAASNDVGQEEIDKMLEPLYEHLGQGKPPPVEVEAPKGRIGVSAPPWASVLDMSKEADLRDLRGALAVFLTRIDDEIFLPAREDQKHASDNRRSL